MELRNLLIAVVLSAFIGAISTWYIAKKEIAAQKDEAAECLVREASFCGGQDLGGLRINMVECNGKEELCLCGDPAMLKKGLK